MLFVSYCPLSPIPVKSHVIISGTGKAGTTALVKILTLAGLDTGYTRGEANQADLEKGGLEYCNPENRWKEGMPEILKSPWFCDTLQEDIDNGMKVRACIVPIRDIGDVHDSRMRHDQSWGSCGHMTMRLQKLLLACARNDIPVRFLPYPEWTESNDWLFCLFYDVFPHEHWNALDEAWREVCG